jgi:hypothetical protein
MNKNIKIEIKKTTDDKNLSPIVFLSTGHKIEFNIGQIVYLKTDIEQKARIVTGINLKPNKGVIYCLACGTNETYHYGIEIDEDKDILKSMIG